VIHFYAVDAGSVLVTVLLVFASTWIASAMAFPHRVAGVNFLALSFIVIQYARPLGKMDTSEQSMSFPLTR
jgi:hypothetical protein